MNRKLVRNLHKIGIGNLIFNVVNGIIMLFVMVVMIYPFWNTIAVSFNDAQDTLRGGLHYFHVFFPPTVTNMYLETI